MTDTVPASDFARKMPGILQLSVGDSMHSPCTSRNADLEKGVLVHDLKDKERVIYPPAHNTEEAT
jgi:hypothetical protein